MNNLSLNVLVRPFDSGIFLSFPTGNAFSPQHAVNIQFRFFFKLIKIRKTQTKKNKELL